MLVLIRKRLKSSSSRNSRRVLIVRSAFRLALMTSTFSSCRNLLRALLFDNIALRIINPSTNSNWRIAFRTTVLSAYVFAYMSSIKKRRVLTTVAICSVIAFTASHLHSHLGTPTDLRVSDWCDHRRRLSQGPWLQRVVSDLLPGNCKETGWCRGRF